MAERQTFKHLVCVGLGYCCVWAFFSVYKRTALIALRLGITDRTVRLNKAKFRAGEYQCDSCTKCLKQRLKGRR